MIMKLNLSILSACIAGPVLATGLVKPLHMITVSGWNDDYYDGNNIDTTFMTSPKLLRLPDLKFFEIGRSGNVSVSREAGIISTMMRQVFSILFMESADVSKCELRVVDGLHAEHL